MNTEMIWKWTLITNKFFRDFSLNDLHKHEEYVTSAAVSRIINRNYAHHIGSHVSPRATLDQIIKRIYGNDYEINT